MAIVCAKAMDLVAGEHLLAAKTASGDVALQVWFLLQSDPGGEGITLQFELVLETFSF